MKALIVAGASLVFLGLLVAMTYVSISNQEISLRTSAEAQQEANAAIFDKTWKVVAQEAQILEKYKDDFKDVYGTIMTDRYRGARAGALMSWINEHNPTLDPGAYKRLMSAVESNRAEFLTGQKRLIDIDREHKALKRKFPGSIFVGSRADLEIIVVTSEKTKQTFTTGSENDIDLFGGEE